MALPVLTLQVAVDANPGDALTWSGGSYPDLASRVENLKIVRGRNSERGTVETGTADMDLRNQDRHLDPGYSGSPYAGKLIPVKQARLRANVLSTDYDLFRGDVFDWEQQWVGRENIVPLRLLDAFEAVAGNDDGIALSAPSEYTGLRINRILDAIGWPSGQRSIDSGQSLLQGHTYDNDNALQALQDASVTWEHGLVFADRIGNVVFHDRHHRFKSPYNVSQVTLSNVPTGAELPFSSATIKYGNERIRNRIIINHVGGNEVIREDTTSKNKYRRRIHSESSEIVNANEVGDLADYLLARWKEPVLHVEEIILEPQLHDNLWAHCLTRELGDRVTINIKPPGSPSEVDVYVSNIERIEHTFTYGRWETKWRMAPADLNDYWVLGTSLLGTNTKLAV